MPFKCLRIKFNVELEVVDRLLTMEGVARKGEDHCFEGYLGLYKRFLKLENTILRGGGATC